MMEVTPIWNELRTGGREGGREGGRVRRKGREGGKGRREGRTCVAGDEAEVELLGEDAGGVVGD